MLLTTIRKVARGDTVIPPVPQEAYAVVIARVDDKDLPVLAMLLDGESLEGIAEALRSDQAEIAWRAQRIIGRLRPRVRTRTDEQASEPANA